MTFSTPCTQTLTKLCLLGIKFSIRFGKSHIFFENKKIQSFYYFFLNIGGEKNNISLFLKIFSLNLMTFLTELIDKF